MRLALEMGVPLSVLRRYTTSEEYGLWKVFDLSEGFPTRRIETAVALAGAALCQTWGGSTVAEQLIPSFYSLPTDPQSSGHTEAEAGRIMRAWAAGYRPGDA